MAANPYPIIAPINKQILQLFRNTKNVYPSYADAVKAITNRTAIDGSEKTVNTFIFENNLQDGEPFVIRYQTSNDERGQANVMYERYEGRDLTGDHVKGGLARISPDFGDKVEKEISLLNNDMSDDKKIHYRLRSLFCIAYVKYDKGTEKSPKIDPKQLSHYDTHIDYFENADEAYLQYHQYLTGSRLYNQEDDNINGTAQAGGDYISVNPETSNNGKVYNLAPYFREGVQSITPSKRRLGLATTNSITTLLGELTQITNGSGNYVTNVTQSNGQITVHKATLPTASVTGVDKTITNNTVTVGLSISDKIVKPVNKIIKVNGVQFQSDSSNNLSASVSGENITTGKWTVSKFEKLDPSDKLSDAIGKIHHKFVAIDKFNEKVVTGVKTSGDTYITMTPSELTTGEVGITSELNLSKVADDLVTSHDIINSTILKTALGKLDEKYISSVGTTDTTYITMVPDTAVGSGAVTITSTLNLAQVATDLKGSYNFAIKSDISTAISNIKGNTSTLTLAGYNSANASSAITTGDTVSSGISKLQYQINQINLNAVTDITASGNGYLTLGVSGSTTRAITGSLTMTGAITEDVGINRLVFNGDGLINTGNLKGVYGALVPETVVLQKYYTDAFSTVTATAVAKEDTVTKAIAKLQKQITSVSGAAKTYTIKKTEKPAANVAARYQLLDNDGNKQGADIDIPVDSSLISAEIGHDGDKIDESTGIINVTGSGVETLNFIYFLSTGKYKLTQIKIGDFLRESEFKDGLQVINGVVSVKTNKNNPVKISTSGKEVIYEIDGSSNAIAKYDIISNISQDKNGVISITKNGTHTFVDEVTDTNSVNLSLSSHTLKADVITDKDSIVEKSTGIEVWRIDCGTF